MQHASSITTTRAAQEATTVDIRLPDEAGAPLVRSTGLTWHELFYPNYRFPKKPRERVYGVLSSDTIRREAVLTAEDGMRTAFPFGGDGYQALRRHVAQNKMTVFTTFVEGTRRFPYLASAIADSSSRIYLSERNGPTGVSVRYGKQKGTIVSENSWHRGPDEADTLLWLQAIRRVMQMLGAGCYDTPSALGTALLYRMWDAEKLPHVLRLPSRMMELFLRYRIGGRVTHESSIGHDYPLVYESDIRSAYPATVAQGVPWGTPVYEHDDPTWNRHQVGRVAYGIWYITVHEPIVHSPIPARDWDRAGGSASWSLDTGSFEYAGWQDEITALRNTGRASAIWCGGWSWAGLSSALDPWVREMAGYRDQAAGVGDVLAERIIKLATNAAIGRWGMEPGHMELVDHEHSQIGDGFIALPAWAYLDGPAEPPDLYVHRDTAHTNATPAHWSSFVRMRVRMELYARTSEGRAQGIEIVMENFDAIVTTAPLDTKESPYKWKVYKRFAAHIPYARAIESWVEDGYGGVTYVRILPGVAQRMRAPATPEKASMAP